MSARAPTAGLSPVLLAAVLLLAGGGAARGDLVHLTNGETVEGRVRPGKTEGYVIVETSTGIEIELKRDQIVKIIRKLTPEDEFARRLKKVPPDELEPLVELAVWAREHRLHAALRCVSRRILELDPNHPMARKALGYVVFENSWIRESELRKKDGLIKFRGEWMTDEERERRLRAEARKEVADLFQSIESDNPYLQEFAVRKLLAYRGEAGLDLLAPYLDDSRPAVRLVASSASFQLSIAILKDAPGGPLRQRAADLLHRTLRKEWVPRLCNELVSRSAALPENGRRRSRDRPERQPEIRKALRRALNVDLGYDKNAWLIWWRANEHRFRDVERAAD